MHKVDLRGEAIFRQLKRENLIVLNGRSAHDGIGQQTFVWDKGQWGSVLDLAIVPETLSADLQVEKVWDFTQMQHHAIFIWAHVAPSEDNSRK